MPPARLLILAETSTEELQHLRDELGRLVAEHGTALVDGSELQDDEDLVEYEALCEEEFGSNLRYSLFLARLMHRFPGIFFKLLAGDQEVIDNFARVATGRWKYERYLRWLVPRLPSYLLRG